MGLLSRLCFSALQGWVSKQLLRIAREPPREGCTIFNCWVSRVGFAFPLCKDGSLSNYCVLLENHLEGVAQYLINGFA